MFITNEQHLSLSNNQAKKKLLSFVICLDTKVYSLLSYSTTP